MYVDTDPVTISHTWVNIVPISQDRIESTSTDIYLHCYLQMTLYSFVGGYQRQVTTSVV
jgi:hypothetical protein